MDDLYDQVPNKNLIPITPRTVEDTQLDFNFLVDLALKTVYADINCSTTRAAESLCLSVPIAESLLQHLYKEKLIEIRGQDSYLNHRYAMLERGWQRVNRLLDINGYIGPAPVSLQSYTEMVLHQSQSREPVSPEFVKNALSDLVLPDITLQTVGLVAKSRRSLSCSVNRGTGKHRSP